LIVSDEDDSRAENLRNKLTLWRLRNLDMDVKSRIKAAQEELKKYPIKKRLAEIAIPLFALIDDELVRAEFISSLQNRSSDAVTEKADTTDGQLIEIIWNLIFEKKYAGDKNDDDGDDFEIVLRQYDKSMVHSVEGKPDERLPVGVIAEKLNEGVLERFQKDEVYVGRLLSKLELKSGRISRRASGEFYQKRAVIFDEAGLRNLFENFNLPENQHFSVVTVVSETTSLDTTINLTTEELSDDSLCRQVKPLEENDLSKVTTVTTEKCEKAIEKENEGTFDENPDAAIEGNFDENTDAEICDLIALDTETEPFNKKLGITPRNAKMIGLSLSQDGQLADYFTDKESWSLMMPDDGQTVVLHNAKFDFGVLLRAGLPLPKKFEDTLIASHLLNENDAHGLKPLAKRHLGIDDPVTFDEADRMRLLDPEIFSEYARNDARYTFQLWEQFKKELDNQELRSVYEMEKAILPVVMAMETRGMKLDIQSLATIEREVKADSARLKTEIFELAGVEFELTKPRAVAAILYDKLGLKCPKETPSGARSVDIESLKEIAHPIAVKLSEYRKIDKLANTFIKVLPKHADADGRIHPEFKPLGAVTGRFSAADPNVQQIPKKSELGKAIRRAFICETGNKLICADFSQMELRVLAHYSQDETLLNAYCTGAATDLHTLTAQKMFNKEDVSKDERGIAKMINFSIAYGITDVGLYRRLTATGIDTTPKDCKRYIADYFKTYGGVKRFLSQVDKTIRERGYVKNLFGRRRRLKGNNSKEIRQAQNFIIQATSADLVKRAMVALASRLPDGADLISMIHDELIIECRSDHAEEVLGIVVDVMQDTPEGFTVPMTVDAHIVDCWADAK
jgi:DNA polymerase-1